MHFWRAHWNFSDKRPQTFHSMSKRDGKILFSQKKLILKKFPWTRKTLFWQLRRIFFRQKAQIFWPTVLKGWKTLISLEIFASWKYFYVHAECSSVGPAQFFSKKGRKLLLFTQCSKRVEKITFRSKKLFFLKIICGHLWCSFDNPTERSSTKRWKKFVQFLKKNLSFKK